MHVLASVFDLRKAPRLIARREDSERNQKEKKTQTSAKANRRKTEEALPRSRRTRHAHPANRTQIAGNRRAHIRKQLENVSSGERLHVSVGVHVGDEGDACVYGKVYVWCFAARGSIECVER